jgi:2-polyprenyl-6-methoxyphenol hydroxylase-like FAD-dependent oxidoreductase
VTVVDRDPGPPASGRWERRGVMQFHHAHTFRGAVVEILRAELPDVLDQLFDAGAVSADDAAGRPIALLCRRSTFDTVLHTAAVAEPGVTVCTGHASIHLERDRVTGVLVDGGALGADVVVDASGRGSRFTPRSRPSIDGECGIVYATRQYRLRDGAALGPVNAPIGLSLGYDRHFAIAFLHDNRTFSVTFAHDGRDPRLRALRHADVFTAAAAAVPQLAEWTDPRRSTPISDVLPAGSIHNRYRGQTDTSGRPSSPGLVSVGDAVCTTTPLAGRGVTLALLQARTLVDLLDGGTDIDSVTARFDDWCTAHIKPWFDDHCYADADRERRWSGADVDPTRMLPSDLIVAASAIEPEVASAVGDFATMDALPASLAAVEPAARAHYARGWRPALPAGPSRDELAAICVLAEANAPTSRRVSA